MAQMKLSISISITITILFIPVICRKSVATGSNYLYKSEESRPCREKYPNPTDTSQMMCECTKDYCDNLVFDWPKKGEILQMTSSKGGKRFKLAHNNKLVRCLDGKNDDADDLIVVFNKEGTKTCLDKNVEQQHIDEYRLDLVLHKQYQEIMGFGGAFTDAALINMDSLMDELKDIVVDNYYGAEGLQYNMARVPISGSDFSTHAYSYDDTREPDLDLSQWKLRDEDYKYKIPYLKKAMKLVEQRTNKDLKIFASSWSPPEWMKTNNDFRRGFLKGTSDKNGVIYKVYAQYLLKFLEAYKANGITLWGMTLQNEPGAAYLPIYFFNALQFSPKDQINFLKFHFGPLLWENGYTKDKFKLIIGDDSIGFVNFHVDKILNDREAKKYISGIGLHWYLDEILPSSMISSLYSKHKDEVEFILSTESCTGAMPHEQKVIPGDWERGVQYCQDIMQTLNRNVNGWIDWNLALDMKGGPNWSGNFVDAPILVDYENNRIYKNPMYYILGHFSRFLPEGSKRIHNKLHYNGSFLNSGKMNSELKISTFLTPTDHLVIIIMNTSTKPRSIAFNAANIDPFIVELEAESITSLAYGLT